MNEDKDIENTTTTEGNVIKENGLYVTGIDPLVAQNNTTFDTWTTGGDLSNMAKQTIYTTQGGTNWASPVQSEAVEALIAVTKHVAPSLYYNRIGLHNHHLDEVSEDKLDEFVLVATKALLKTQELYNSFKK